MKFVFCLISQHAAPNEKSPVICGKEREREKKNSLVPGSVADLFCSGSLLIKNVGVILSFDKHKADLDC